MKFNTCFYSTPDKVSNVLIYMDHSNSMKAGTLENTIDMSKVFSITVQTSAKNI